MIRVKICGITNSEDAMLASEEGADAVGFIFSKKSPRYIRENVAKKIVSSLDPFIVKVGVFLDEEKEKVGDIAQAVGLDVLQFHGQETASYCHSFKPKFKVIKVLFPQQRPFREKIAEYRVDAFLFDIRYEEKIKRKKTLSTAIIKEVTSLIKEGVRVIISGGLDIKNVSRVKKVKPYAVDVASGVEAFVGKKDTLLVRRFIREVKK